MNHSVTVSYEWCGLVWNGVEWRSRLGNARIGMACCGMAVEVWSGTSGLGRLRRVEAVKVSRGKVRLVEAV